MNAYVALLATLLDHIDFIWWSCVNVVFTARCAAHKWPKKSIHAGLNLITLRIKMDACCKPDTKRGEKLAIPASEEKKSGSSFNINGHLISHMTTCRQPFSEGDCSWLETIWSMWECRCRRHGNMYKEEVKSRQPWWETDLGCAAQISAAWDSHVSR